jgi:hypothetical protein
MRVESCDSGEELVESVQVELVGEDLDDDWWGLA